MLLLYSTLDKSKVANIERSAPIKFVSPDAIDVITTTIPEVKIPEMHVSSVTTEPPTTTIKKSAPETVPVQVEQPESVPVDTACGPYKMPRASAHACWDGLIYGPTQDPYTWDDATAFNVMFCESQGKYDAHNPSGANGLFQELGGPTDPAANVAQAYSMWQTRSWEPWDASRYCWS